MKANGGPSWNQSGFYKEVKFHPTPIIKGKIFIDAFL